ncbi:MAG: hypothetical protein KY458_14690, partial [Actinobacteria bacterium]|nr:hypothetical protein [Actinomycetota bacterium]
MVLSRRHFLLGSASGLVAVVVSPRRVLGRQGSQEIDLTAVAAAAGSYLYLPFDVPTGVNRIGVKITKSGGDAKTGVGLFDERGAAYQSNGFRGIYGEERSELFVAASEASQSFLPGTINPGRWTVIVPVFTQTIPTEVTARVT